MNALTIKSDAMRKLNLLNKYLGVQIFSLIFVDKTMRAKKSAAAATQKYTEVVCRIVLIGKTNLALLPYTVANTVAKLHFVAF